ncbi:acyl-CoA thioesterase [Microbulbifer litoralis]|uniref:acyl-CoA thioesterase n=1 Tax=Microbulbifer litoralis TaxID=2933965 RepID=UPI002028ADA4|nr:thioesterase family protein [Microbulbifer sp. GX H0434]
MVEKTTAARGDYRVFYPITTRWMDNDIYGHVNNVTYYSYFDSAVNRYLIEEGGLDIHRAPVVGFVVNSSCDYRAPIAYPQAIEAGLRVARLGNSSVTYEVGIFRRGEDSACAAGSFTHVFVERAANRSVAIPEPIRRALQAIQMENTQ